MGQKGANVKFVLYPLREDTGHIGEIPTTPVGYVVPWMYGAAFDSIPAYSDSNRGHSGRKRALRDMDVPDRKGQISIAITPAFFGWPLHYLGMDEVYTPRTHEPSTPPIHAFAPSASGPNYFFALEKWFMDLGKYDLYTGIVISAISFQHKGKGKAIATLDLLGVGDYLSDQSSPLDANPTEEIGLELFYKNLIGTTGNVMFRTPGGSFSAFSIFEEIDQKLENADIERVDFLAGCRPECSTLNVSGSIIVPYDNETLRAIAGKTALADRDSGIDLILPWGADAPTSSLEIATPHVAIEDNGQGNPKDKKRIQLTYPFNDFDDGSADASVSITLINDVDAQYVCAAPE